MGEAGTAHGGQQDRDPPGDNDRRVPPGQRVGPEGTRVARGDRAAVEPVVSTTEARGAVEAVWRMESARIVGALARYNGRFLAGRAISRRRHSRRHSSPGPWTGCLPSRRDGCSPLAAGGPSMPFGEGPRAT